MVGNYIGLPIQQLQIRVAQTDEKMDHSAKTFLGRILHLEDFAKKSHFWEEAEEAETSHFWEEESQVTKSHFWEEEINICHKVTFLGRR